MPVKQSCKYFIFIKFVREVMLLCDLLREYASDVKRKPDAELN